MKQLKQLQRNGIGAHDLHNKVQFALPAELRSLVRSRSRVTCSSIGSCVLKVVSAKYRPIVSADISTDMSVDTRSIRNRYSVDTLAAHRSSVGRVSVDGSVDTRPRCMSVDSASTVGRYFTDTSPILYRYFTEVSVTFWVLWALRTIPFCESTKNKTVIIYFQITVTEHIYKL